MVCDVCGKRLRRRMASIDAPYHYLLSGLPNIFLAGISVYDCAQCSAEVPVIPRMAELHRVIVLNLVEKPGGLSGEEVRFLRKFSGRSAQAFANIVRVDPCTLSRIENNAQPIGETLDKMVRVVAMAAKSMKEARRILLQAESEGPPEQQWHKVVLAPSHGGWKAAA